MNFVTGATGLIGSHLVLRLAEEGMPVSALFRNENGKSEVFNLFQFYGKENLFSQVQWVKGDVEDADDMFDLTEGMQTVFHCAAIVSYHRKEATRMLEVNINGTKNVVNACIENEVKHLIHVSSISALGDSKGEVIDEETPRDFNDYHSNYSKGKYLSEQEVWRGIQEGLDATIVNIRMSELFTKIADALHVKIGKTIAKKWQIVLVFYMEALVELITGKRATITREIIRNYDEVKQFDGSKATRAFGFEYRNTFSSVEDTIRYYKVLSKGATQAD